MDRIDRNKKDRINSAIWELRDDLADLKTILAGYFFNLTKVRQEFIKKKNHLFPQEYNLALTNNKHFNDLYLSYNRELDKLKNRVSNINKGDIRLYNLLHQSKNNYYRILRSQSLISSSTHVETDWQSPSFEHSVKPEAGLMAGDVSGTINDYKRDTHPDAIRYEKKFVEEYYRSKFKFLLKAYLTNSGMAAFQTIFTYLMSERKIREFVLCGNGSYFQYKQILSGSLGDKLISADESNTDEIIAKIKKFKPSVIFLDTICNSHHLSVPDIEAVCRYLSKEAKRETYLIIDTACTAVKFQPFLPARNKRRVRIITFESLNKYHQFGLDRVTAGIIVCENRDARGIFEYRKHAGTIITDSSVYALPLPSRKLLDKRLNRHQRNALELALFLNRQLWDGNFSKIESVIYPGLSDHSGFNTTRKYEFSGSFFNIKLKKKFASRNNMKKLVGIIIRQAKKNNIDLIAGTSFGLNTTRIYLTSLWTSYGQPFLRISAGTEDIIQLEKIKKVMKEALSGF